MVCDHLRVDRGLEDRTCVFQVMAELRRIDQVSIVRQRKRALHIVQHQRLGILPRGSPRRRVAHMSHANIPTHRFQAVLREHLVHQSHPFIGYYFSFRTTRLTDGDPAALLSPVLQCEQPVIDRGGDIPSIKIIDAKDAARFLQTGPVKISVDIFIIHIFFLSPRSSVSMRTLFR